MFVGSTLCLAESIDTLLVNLAEIVPTDFTSVPRFYEKVWSAVEGLPAPARARAAQADLRPEGPPPLVGRGSLAEICRGIGFAEAGLPLLEGYGMTESSPVISFNRLGRLKSRVGRPTAR